MTGDDLKHWRQARAMSQKQLAEWLKRPRATIGWWERKGPPVTVTSLLEMALNHWDCVHPTYVGQPRSVIVKRRARSLRASRPHVVLAGTPGSYSNTIYETLEKDLQDGVLTRISKWKDGSERREDQPDA
jgi:transcriptional regulator with XRE-family HTH domain